MGNSRTDKHADGVPWGATPPYKRNAGVLPNKVAKTAKGHRSKGERKQEKRANATAIRHAKQMYG